MYPDNEDTMAVRRRSAHSTRSARRAPFPPHSLALASLAALTLAPALWPAPAAAQATLPTVEVIGVSPIPGVDVPRDRIPANVQTARSADIERAQALDLSDFL